MLKATSFNKSKYKSVCKACLADSGLEECSYQRIHKEMCPDVGNKANELVNVLVGDKSLERS